VSIRPGCDCCSHVAGCPDPDDYDTPELAADLLAWGDCERCGYCDAADVAEGRLMARDYDAWSRL
jgi:hypothetical protein